MVEGRAKMPEPLILMERWMETMKWLLDRTSRFPQRLRHSLTERIEVTALEVLEQLTTAQYRKNREPLLRLANEALNRLRILIRLAHEIRLLSNGQYGEAAVRFDEAGRLLGGWMKSNAVSPEQRAKATSGSELGMRPALSDIEGNSE